MKIKGILCYNMNHHFVENILIDDNYIILTSNNNKYRIIRGYYYIESKYFNIITKSVIGD